MSLWQDGEPNLLALSGGRQLKVCPWHFTRVTIDRSVDNRAAQTWIWKNLEGRFCMLTTWDMDMKNQIRQVAFEEPYEASAFVLSQPLMSQNHDDFW